MPFALSNYMMPSLLLQHHIITSHHIILHNPTCLYLDNCCRGLANPDHGKTCPKPGSLIEGLRLSHKADGVCTG